jgi:hypothetical protein
MVSSLLQGIVCAFSALMAAKVNQKNSALCDTVDMRGVKLEEFNKQGHHEEASSGCLHDGAVQFSCLIFKLYV